LADNEGILQGVHNLFVHQSSSVDLQKIARYVELVPLPDVVLYLQQEEEVLISRALARGHARVTGNSQDHVVHFIRQAVKAFNEMIHVMKIQERLIVVDSELNIHSTMEVPFSSNFQKVTELVRSGR
jgi:thymidylate kinase